VGENAQNVVVVVVAAVAAAALAASAAAETFECWVTLKPFRQNANATHEFDGAMRPKLGNRTVFFAAPLASVAGCKRMDNHEEGASARPGSWACGCFKHLKLEQHFAHWQREKRSCCSSSSLPSPETPKRFIKST